MLVYMGRLELGSLVYLYPLLSEESHVMDQQARIASLKDFGEPVLRMILPSCHSALQ
jgi:hypothetical protein